MRAPRSTACSLGEHFTSRPCPGFLHLPALQVPLLSQQRARMVTPTHRGETEAKGGTTWLALSAPDPCPQLPWSHFCNPSVLPTGAAYGRLAREPGGGCWFDFLCSCSLISHRALCLWQPDLALPLCLRPPTSSGLGVVLDWTLKSTSGVGPQRRMPRGDSQEV